jgi:hypothetical protein
MGTCMYDPCGACCPYTTSYGVGYPVGHTAIIDSGAVYGGGVTEVYNTGYAGGAAEVYDTGYPGGGGGSTYATGYA